MNEFDQEAAGWDASPYRTERAQVVAQGIIERVALNPRMTALEYGCGTGLLSFALQSRLGQQSQLGRIYLADSSAGMLAEVEKKIAAGGRQNMAPLKLDLSTDPLPPFQVQMVYTLMTLHHIPDTAGMLGSFYRLLSAPGWLCVADLDSEDGSFHGPEFTGHKGFDRAELEGLVRAAGFGKVSFSTIYHTPHKVGSEIRRFPVFLMVAEKQDK